MEKEEIFAEKIRAILTRKMARDLFGLDFLLQNGIHAKKSLITKKMEYYNEAFDSKKLIKKIKGLEKDWKKELTGFTSNLPDFKKVEADVLKRIKKLYT